MVQIMKDDRTKPHFRPSAAIAAHFWPLRVATGRFYSAPTREFATIGRVLTSPTDGLEPFEGVPSHVLYATSRGTEKTFERDEVMLQLAVPLRGFDRTRPPPDVRPDSYFIIQAPPALNSAVRRP